MNKYIDRGLWFVVIIWAVFAGVIYPIINGWTQIYKSVAFFAVLCFLMFYYNLDKKMKVKKVKQ